MSDLEDLFSGPVEASESHCVGCPVLKKNKPRHCIKDYESMEELDILFLSDSVKWNYGDSKAFRTEERDLIVDCLHPMYDHIRDGLRIDFAASVKCPNMLESDMNPVSMNSCRNYLDPMVDKLKPKLIFACGNLALKMLTKKSGIGDKRGTSYEYKTEKGHVCRVVALYHPFAVVQEPRMRYLFELDIRNGYNKYILGIVDKSKFSYEGIHDIKQLENYGFLKTTEEPIGIDIETTGLDFKKDLIQTIAFSFSDGNVCLPIDHRFTPFSEYDRKKVLEFISEVLGNKNNKKIFQNHTFDRKFLLRYNIRCAEGTTWDTKLLAKLIREDAPNGLKSLVTEYFADELQDL
jgi:hypothetical protein